MTVTYYILWPDIKTLSYLVVTTRCPVSYERVAGKIVRRDNIGGVAVSLNRLMSKEGGVWICWGDGSADSEHLEESYNGYKIVRILIPQREKRGFYDDYSNGILWPLFHYFRERIKYYGGAFDSYEYANRIFLDAVLRHVSSDMVVWIHDYQLSLLPGMVRQKSIRNTIVFTWHIPWVSAEFFATLPESRKIVSSIVASDVITFHTDQYRLNFIHSADLLLGRSADYAKKSYSIPLGIDYSYYAGNAKHAKNPFDTSMKVIFSIDRLDYTKGLTNRVLSIRTLLERHPDLAGKFVYVMIVNPSRTSVKEYVNFKRELEMNIGRINGEYASVKWVPIIYIYKKVTDTTLLSYYKYADVALITPLIDGLNLVCKEFVAATDHGVLILSKFAGSSSELKEAIIVNPNSLSEMADALYNAINMDREESGKKLEIMKSEIKKRNITWWLARIKQAVERSNYEPTISDFSQE